MRYLNGVWVAANEFQPMGEPESRIELPGDLTLGMWIPAPFGRDTDAQLALRAIDDGTPGGVITLAITTMVNRATPNILDNLQSSPRIGDDYVDGA